MDAKSRAKFINSISDKPENEPADKQTDEEIPTISKASDNISTQNNKLSSDPIAVDTEEEVFAQGLPSWDLEPPQVAVRRMRKK